MTTATKPPREGRVTRDTAHDLDAELQAIDWEPAKIETDLIDAHPANRQVTVPECGELAESIRKTGRLLERVKVRDVGGGRYQMLGGQRRLTAHLILGWPAIESEVCTCSDAAARALVSLLNSQRKDLNPIEQARDIAGLCLSPAEGGAGMTREEAGKVHGLTTGQAASNKLRLLDLPDILQMHVADGTLPETFARVVLPYLVIGQPLENWLRTQLREWGDDRPSRENFAWELDGVVANELTRPMTPHKFSRDQSEWELQSQWCKRLFEPSDADRKKLRIVTLPDRRGKLTEDRACNVALWERLQKAAVPKAKRKLAELKAAPKKNGKAAKPKLSPAEQASEKARKTKEANERTAAAVAAWRLRLLRCLIAGAVRPGHEAVTGSLAVVQATATRRRNEYRTEQAPHGELLDAAIAIQAARHDVATTRKKQTGLTVASEVRRAINDAREDPVTAAEELQCLLLQLYLWPHLPAKEARHAVDYLIAAGDALPQPWRPMTVAKHDQLKPVELLELDAAEIEALAEWYGVSVHGGWKQAGNSGTTHRRLAEEFFELHSRSQLALLAKEICRDRNAPDGKSSAATWVGSAGNKSDAIKCLLQLHTAAAPLLLPKCLQPTPKKAKKR